MMNGAQMLPGVLGGVAAGFVALGAYEAIKPMAWDQLKLTGSNGYIARVVNMLPVLTPNLKADTTNFAEKSLGLATIAGLGYIVSSKKALNLLDQKMTMGAVGIATVIYGINFLGELQTLNLGNVFGALSKGNFQNAKNQFGSNNLGGIRLGNTHHNMNVIGGAHNNMGMMHMGGGHNMAGMHNYSMGGAHNQLQTANTAAIQQGAGNSGFFGTKGLGAARVNLF
tara:strand:+ start:418 stop:1092 length:675 start_codon:yes stop_codon:yes gene_type:complete